MQGKYSNWPQYLIARAQRAFILSAVRPLVDWQPIDNPKEGYTLVIGCSTPLAEMLGATLRMIQKQDLTHLDRILVVFDRPADQLPVPIEQRMRGLFPDLPLEFFFYTPNQAAVTKKIGLPWVYCWLSWMIAIAQVRTRYVLLQDFDAMLIRRDIIEERYRVIREQNAQYCGVRNYGGGGLNPDDPLVVTFEMMFDAEFVRRTFRPIDLINTIRVWNGRSVDFDILLWAQAREGKSIVLPIHEEDMVHPSQVIDQFTRLTHIAGWVPPAQNNLLMIPYFMYLAEKPELLNEQRELLNNANGATGVPFFGKQLDLSRLPEDHVNWVEKQAGRLERAVAGGVRPEVAGYFQAIRGFVARRNAAGDVAKIS